MLTVVDQSPDAVASRLDGARKLENSLACDRQRDVLHRWIETAGQGGVSRHDLRPEMFGRMLQFVALVEVLEGGTDYRHIVEGREVVRWFGKSGEDRFSALYMPDHFARLQSLYLSVQLAGRPVSRNFMTRSIEDEELAFSQLVLPATDEEGVVRFLAIVFGFPDSVRRVSLAPLRLFAPWRRLRKGIERDTMLGDHKWR